MTGVDGRSGRVLQIASLVPPARYGGAERVVGWLGDELRARGLTVRDAGLSARGDATTSAISNVYWPFDGSRHGVAARTVWHAVDSLALRARRTLDRIVDEFRPTVIVTHNLRGWGLAPWVVADRHGVPLVHVVHDYGLLCNASTLWRGRVCDGVCAPCLPRRDAARRRWPGGHVVGVSRAVLDEHERRGLGALARDGLVLHPSAAAGVVPAQPTGAASSEVPGTIGYLGRLDDAKGVPLLLAAMRGSTQRLLVAGRGEESYVDALRSASGRNVEWLGWIDPTELLGKIDLLVVPSSWPEPFGLVVVEAAAAGVPVLLADQPGLVEAARCSGAAYSVFPHDDVDALRRALERPLSDHRRSAPTDETCDVVGLVASLASAGATGD